MQTSPVIHDIPMDTSDAAIVLLNNEARILKVNGELPLSVTGEGITGLFLPELTGICFGKDVQQWIERTIENRLRQKSTFFLTDRQGENYLLKVQVYPAGQPEYDPENIQVVFEKISCPAMFSGNFVQTGNNQHIQTAENRESITESYPDKEFLKTHLAAITENLPGAILRYRLNPDGSDSILYVSEGAAFLWGMDARRCMEDNQKVWDIFYPGDLKNVRDAIRRSAELMEKWEQEWRVLHPDGRIRWQRGIGNPIRMPDGSTIWDSIILDITDFKRAQEERDQTLFYLGERVKEQTCLYKIARLSNDNLNTEQLLQSAADILPSGWAYPECAHAEVSYNGQVYMSEGFTGSEWVMSVQRRTGSDRELAISVYYSAEKPLMNEGPFLEEERQLLNSIADNLVLQLDNIQGKRKLEESEQKLRMIFHSEPHCVKMVSTEGELLEMNPAGLRLMEAEEEPDLVCGKTVWELIHPDDRDTYLKLHNQALAGNRAEARFRITGLKGTERWVESVSVPLKNEDGYVSSILSVTHDISEKCRSELDLTTARANQEALINNTSDLIWSVDENNRIITANKAFTDFCYLLTGRHMRSGDALLRGIFSEDIQSAWDDALQSAFRGENLTEQLSFIHPVTGDLRNVMLSVHPILDVSGKVTGVACHSRDITEISRQKNLLARAKSELEKILHSSLDMICTIDRQGRFVRVSEACFKILGYRPEEMEGISFISFADPEDIPATNRFAADLMNGKPVTNFENSYIRKDGTRVPLMWSMHWDEQEEKIYCVARDASALKEAAEKLRASEQRFRSLVQEGADLTAILDKEANFVYISPNYFTILGYTNEDLSGKNGFDFFHPNDREKILTEFRRLDTETRVKSSPYRFRKKNGGWMWMQSTGTNMFHDDHISGIVVNSIDITEIVNTQERLKRSEARYRGFYESQTNFVIRTDMEGNYSYVNRKFLKEFSWLYPDGNILGTNCLTSICEWDREKVKETVMKCIAEPGQVFKVEIDKPGMDGAIKSTLWDFMCVVDGKGNPSEIQCMGIDISDRKLFESELRKSNERFELVMQAGFESIWDLNVPSMELYLGDGFRRNFGMEVKTLQENYQYSNSFLHPDDKEVVLQDFIHTLFHTQASGWSREYRFRKSNGEYAYVKNRALIIRDEKGNPVRVVGAIKDISIEHFFSRLEEIEKEVITSGIRHDAKLESVLTGYLRKLEELFPVMKTTVMRIENGRLKNLASPSMEREYLDAIQEQHIGPGSGSCGTAAYLKEKVVVENVYTDQRWADHVHLARRFGFSACWSQPIFNADGEVFATFAGYYREPRLPDTLEEHAIERAQRLISLLLTQFEYLENLQKSNERYELVNKATNDAIYDWDVAEDIFYWGESFSRIFGHDVNGRAFRLSDLELLMHPVDRARNQNSWNEFIGNPEIHRWHEEFRFKKADGNYVHVEETGYLLRDTQGKPLRMIGVLRDISSTKEMKRLLDNASALSRVGGWDVDMVTGKHHWSAMTKEIHEVDPGYEPDHDSSVKYYREDIREKVTAIVTEAMANGITFDFEMPIITEKGNERWVRVIGNPEYENGKCVRLFGSFQDIHQRKMAELELQRTSQERNSILESIGDAFFALDKKWMVTYWNRQAENLLKTPREQIINRHLWDVFTESTDSLSYTRYHEAMSLGEARHFEDFYAPLQCWLEVSAYPSETGLSVYFKDITARKEAEYNLLQYKNVIENSMDGIGILTIPDNRIYLNQAFVEKLGYTAEEMAALGGPLQVYADKQAGAKMFESIFSGNYWKGDIQLYNKQGHILDFHLSAGPVIDQDNRIVAVYGIHTDISERKKMERELLEYNNRISVILESITDGFFSVDNAWTITYWNREAVKLVGTPAEAVVGKNLWHIFKDALPPLCFEEFHKAVLNSESVHFEEYFRGAKKWLEVTAYPSEKGLSVYFRDVTTRKKAEDQLIQSNERFKKVAEATNDAIWDLDIENGMIFWGTGYKTLFGYDTDLEQRLFENWEQKIHPEDAPDVKKSLSAFIFDPANQKWQHEYRYRKADGGYAFVIDRGLAIRNKQGKAIRMVGAMTDITFRKEYEESLKKLNAELDQRAHELTISNAELEQFAYVASHDLQEPLRMVTSFLAQLEKKYHHLIDEKGKQYIHFAVDGAKRMRSIILDLLEFSRVGKHTGKLETISVQDIIREVCLMQGKMIEEASAVIHSENLPEVICYRTPLLQIFHNLIGNALKYRKAGIPAEITITSSETTFDWEFAVTDNGIGIEEEYFGKIFIIFQRLHSRDAYQGTGMGLAIVKKHVENLGGKIQVESVHGVGSTFRFSIRKMNF